LTQALDRMRASGMFALAQPGRLEDVLTEARHSCGLQTRTPGSIERAPMEQGT